MLMVVVFALLGLPVVRDGERRARFAAVLELAILLSLAILHAGMPTLIFIVVASAFRHGMTLPARLWTLFVAAEFALLVGALLLSPHIRGEHSPAWIISTGGYAAVALTLVLASIRYAHSARAAFDELSSVHAELQRNVSRIGELATLRERERIALAIHDGLGHEMTSLAMQIEAARCLLETTAPAEPFLSRAHATSLQVLAAVRRSVHDNSSDPLERDPLDSAIRRVCDRFALASGIDLSLDANQLPPLSPPTTTHIVNIVREALTNVGRHAGASAISVRATVNDGELTVIVEDNGRGFAPALNESGHGLHGMRSRAEAIDASIEIRSVPGAGCSVRIVVPLEAGLIAR
jgi:signal transduction histidine kinase